MHMQGKSSWRAAGSRGLAEGLQDCHKGLRCLRRLVLPGMQMKLTGLLMQVHQGYDGKG